MQKQITNKTKILEDYAFYESGLSSHGCIDKLDLFAKKAIKRYGEILLNEQLTNIKDGFQGCCYACEPVGELNLQLSELAEFNYEILNYIHSQLKSNSSITIDDSLHSKILESLNIYKTINE